MNEDGRAGRNNVVLEVGLVPCYTRWIADIPVLAFRIVLVVHQVDDIQISRGRLVFSVANKARRDKIADEIVSSLVASDIEVC